MTLLDSPLYGRSFVDDEIRSIFSSESFVARCVETEVALARAQARLGIIPVEAADGIASAASTLALDMTATGRY